MSAEGGEAPSEPPPEAAAEAAPPEDGAEGAEDADVDTETTERFDPSRKMSRKSTTYKRGDSLSQDRVDVDRTALEAILDVGSRLQDIQKKSKVSMSTLALAHESYKDKQVNKVVN